MSNDSMPVELLDVREKIDAIDAQLLGILAARFELTHQVGLLKASQDLQALDSGREAEKLARLRELAVESGLNPDLVADLFSKIMQEVVRNHQKLKS